MKQYHILLCCGAGMSSGFLAQQMRNSAKKRGISAVIRAKNQNDLEGNLEDVHILLVGPHLAYAKEDFESKCSPYGIPVVIIDKDIYGQLDGMRMLNDAIQIIDGKEEEGRK